MTPRRLVPAGVSQIEQRIANSRFLAYAAPAGSPEEAREFLTRIRAEHPQASHAVPAYRIGHGASISEHCSDAGEPAGTAGRPSLVVLQGSGIGNVVVVVVRYFGGTRLGTGGLVRAYTGAVQEVLKDLPLAELKPTAVLQLCSPYVYYERIVNLIERFSGQVLNVEFGAEVTIRLRLLNDFAEEFKGEIRELSRGTLKVEVLETETDHPFPIGTLSSLRLPGGEGKL